MSVLGVLVCEVLELEFAHLLATDGEIARVTVVEDLRSTRLLDALRRETCTDLVTIPRVDDFSRESGPGIEVLVQVQDLALHVRPKGLQEGLTAAASCMGPLVDVLFLGYGLCGNALEKPEELLADAGVPIVIPMDEDHPVDDCVGMIIGGRQAYFGEQCKIAGTYFMTPGWTFHWKRIFDKECGDISLDLAKELFTHYKRSLLISTPIMPIEEMEQNAEEFNQMFDCQSEVREGTSRILDDAWILAKQRVTGTCSG